MSPLEQAIQENNLNQLRLLLELWNYVNEETEDGHSLLHVAIQVDYDVEIIKILLTNGLEVNARDESENTPLHKAVYFKNIKKHEFAELFVANGAKVNARNKAGETTKAYQIKYYSQYCR